MSDRQPGSIAIFDERPEGRITLLRIDDTGLVTAFNGHVDLGTGIQTALGQIVAEELNLSMDHVEVVLGDTSRTPNQGPTIASETIQITAVPLRQAAAQLRQMLEAEAARKLNAAASNLECREAAVWDEDKGVSYAELVAGTEIAVRLDPNTQVKEPRDYQIVGTSAGRVDLSAKVTGEFEYIHDLKLPEMVHGHVIRPPYAGRDSGAFIGCSLISYDESAVAGMPGFIAVVREGDFLGVVAQTAHEAQRIAEKLPVNWQMPPAAPDLGDLKHALRNAPSMPRMLNQEGDYDRAIKECGVRLSRTYVWPYHLHGSIGPSCAIADWNDGAPEIWSGSQNPHMLRDDLANLVNLAPEAIVVRRLQAAGCYGRNCADDVCGDALLMSRAVGRVVRVQLTRAQESLWEPKGAAQLIDVTGGVAGDPDLHAYALDTWYPSNRGPNLALLLTGRISPEPRPSDMGDRTTVPPYRVPNKKIVVHDMAPLVRAAWMRGVSALPNTFAHESFMDELAFEIGEDPIAFRLRHLDDPRTRELVQRTAAEAGWEAHTGPRLQREGRMAYGRGFAYATYVHGTFPGTAAASAAWVCDVSVDTETGEVTLTRVLVGQDQGLVINPAGVAAQIHGNVMQTASRALQEEIVFDSITPAPQSWANYPIQTFDQLPEVRTFLIERPDEPALGVGESAAVPAAAAIANAIFDATGVRLREAPFTPAKVRAALSEADVTPLALAQPSPPRRSGGVRRALAFAGGLAGLLTLGAVAVPMARSIPPQAAPAASTFSLETIERGRQVFAAGDCAVCHTAEDGLPNTGGRPLETPFGTVYSTNLTPDPETGLGLWSFAAFDRAMRKGISRDGHNLYPAFPFTSFAKMTGEDMQALYAYLQTLAPVSAQTPPAQMVAPLNLRPVNAVWNAMFHDPRPVAIDPTQSAEWNRGKYLVEAAGHCSACHSPRNLLGAEQTGSKALSGAIIDGWFAPALAGEDFAARGWDADRLYAYLRQGHTPGLASASGPMGGVVDSLVALPDADIRAMSIYLSSLATPGIEPAPPPEPATLLPDTGARLFRAACSSCHEPGLADSLTAAQVPLARSMAIRAPSVEALETVIAEGIEAPLSLPLRDMPGFRQELSPMQITELSHYLRARYAPDLAAWPGSPIPLSAGALP